MQTRLPARRVASIEALTNSEVLSELVGSEVTDVAVGPLPGIGYSSAALKRVDVALADGSTRAFVFKRIDLSIEWMARRTGDVHGRESLLLDDEQLRHVWDVFTCPYLAWAAAGEEIALLLVDLTPHLLPDVRAPLSRWQEERLIAAIAALHATYWNVRLPALRLVSAAQFCDILGPVVATDPAAAAMLPATIRDAVPQGWRAALNRVPARVATLLTRPATAWSRDWDDLPRTLLHGDVKVANFAIDPDGRVWAFDWAIAGAGPCGIDVGWYLAVNASRLSGSKQLLLDTYRSALEGRLARPLPENDWQRLQQVAVVAGARMLLWSKALAVDAGRAGAVEEWQWWIDRLEGIA